MDKNQLFSLKSNKLIKLNYYEEIKVTSLQYFFVAVSG